MTLLYFFWKKFIQSVILDAVNFWGLTWEPLELNDQGNSEKLKFVFENEEWVVLRHNGPNIGFRGKDDVKIIEVNFSFFLPLLLLKIFDLFLSFKFIYYLQLQSN